MSPIFASNYKAKSFSVSLEHIDEIIHAYSDICIFRFKSSNTQRCFKKVRVFKIRYFYLNNSSQ